jgi:hypothetical protein
MDSPVRFVVSVLGSVRVEAPDAPNRRDLSTSKRNMLAVLVAAGPTPNLPGSVDLRRR